MHNNEKNPYGYNERNCNFGGLFGGKGSKGFNSSSNSTAYQQSLAVRCFAWFFSNGNGNGNGNRNGNRNGLNQFG